MTTININTECPYCKADVCTTVDTERFFPDGSFIPLLCVNPVACPTCNREYHIALAPSTLTPEQFAKVLAKNDIEAITHKGKVTRLTHGKN